MNYASTTTTQTTVTQPRSRRRRNLIILVVVLGVIIVLGAFAARPRNDALTARVVKVAYTRYQMKLPETGVVQRPLTQTLTALVSGNVDHIYVRPGQHVGGGQLLATISNPQLVNAEQTAHQAYVASAGHARTTASTNSVLPAQNRSSIVQAEAALEQAR
ncbi:MAG TPA: biotin/lipoyl-binding protein, partial [Candidatus Elarobacter sp.]